MISLASYLSPAQAVDAAAFTFQVDCAPAIQAAINTLPPQGGLITVPVGGYRLNSTVTVGNGTVAAASTKNGVRLVGEAFCFGISSYVQNAPVLFELFGTAHSGSCIQINGPCTGIEISNIAFTFDYSAGKVARGIVDLGASYSCFKNIGVFGPADFGIIESAQGPAGATMNVWENTYVWMDPNFSATSAQAILMTADASKSANSDRAFDSWTNVNIVLCNTGQVGIQFQYVDSIKLRNLMFNPVGTGKGATALFYNYSVYPKFPSCCTIWDVDVFNGYVGNGGSAPSGQGNLVNRIYNFSQGNGAAIPNLPNLKIID